MDPIETLDEEVLRLKNRVVFILERIDENCSIHDFRVVEGEHQTNLIFDMIVPREYDSAKKEKIGKNLTDLLQEKDHVYQCVITMEHSFVSESN